MASNTASLRSTHRRFFACSLLALLVGSAGCSGAPADTDEDVTEPDGGSENDASDASASDSGSGTTCGYLNKPCCGDSTCSAGLVCDDGTCVPNVSDAGDTVPCGKLDQPCCPATGCGSTLLCEDGQCVKKGSGKIGTACDKGSDCKSGVCLGLSNGKSVCTTACADSECPAGWSCEAKSGQSEKVCTCQPKSESCNGLDDDCNGVIDDSAACEQTCTTPGQCPLATELSVTGVVLYQAVGIPLMSNGTEIVQRNAPVIMGKDAMLRVHVSPKAGWLPRSVTAWLELYGSSGLVATYSSTLEVTAASDDKKLATTFNFDIPGARMTGDLGYRISLREKSPSAQFPGTPGAAAWPNVGVAQFDAEDSRGNFKFTLIPYRYNGRLPDTSEQQLQRFRDRFTSYPTPNIEITVHAPLDHSGTFDAQGNGWNQLLNKVCGLRQNEKPARNNYYYGLISPAADLTTFCANGCTAGLAYMLADPNDNPWRCGIGLGFTGVTAADTALHELGHTLGREHAPCGSPGSVDKFFPYANATIGVRGYEMPRKALREANIYKDFMSYCSPVWISDYTYNALFDRIRYVNAMPLVLPPKGFPERWQSIVVEADGSLHIGAKLKLESPPSGTPTSVYLLDGAGTRIGTAKGYLYQADHVPGGSLVVPENELAGAKAIRIEGSPPVSL